MTAFGKKGQETGGYAAGSRPLAGSAELSRPIVLRSKPSVTQPSPHVIYREGETERPAFHNSHLEKHWPKYLAVAAAAFALGYFVYEGKRDAVGLTFAPALFGGFSYLFLNGLRKSLNNMHTARTQLFRSPASLAGGLVGLGYFIYSTFISPTMIMGVEWGAQTAFHDGLQQADMGAVASLLLKGAGYLVVGGLAAEFLSKKLFGGHAAGGADNAR